MKRLTYATRQLLPSIGSVVAYWVITIVLIAVAASGLKETGRDTATLWGLSLSGFGLESHEILQNAYLEMMCHVWTFVTLPFVAFVGTRPVVRSFRSDFLQFLRFSHSTRLFIEVSRTLAVAVVVGTVSLPFVAATLWGVRYPGLGWTEGFRWIATCVGTGLFVAVLIYLLAFLGAPSEVISAMALVIPFFLTGLLAYLEKVDLATGLKDMLPPGLPYSVYPPPPVTSTTLIAPNVQAGIGLAVGVILLRLIASVKTRWLCAAAMKE